jgi:hypothetical protein
MWQAANFDLQKISDEWLAQHVLPHFAWKGQSPPVGNPGPPRRRGQTRSEWAAEPPDF